MARWRQVKDPETGKYHLIPLDDAAIERDERMGIIVRGNFDAFISPVDGSLIRNGRDMAEHCRKHGVVPTQEFNQEYFDRKAEERAKFFKGEHRSQEQIRRDRMELHEQINYLERNA
jgi:hypothetical protein